MITRGAKIFSYDEPHLKYDHETTCETELSNSLEDFHSYLVYKRISHEDGVSKENIAQWYGEIGLNCYLYQSKPSHVTLALVGSCSHQQSRVSVLGQSIRRLELVSR